MTYVRSAAAAGLAQSGVPIDDLQFFIDFLNQSSWGPNQTTTWTDTIASVSGTVSGPTIVNSHLNFAAGTDVVDFGVLPTALEDIFAGGGTVAAWIRVESDGGNNFGRIVDTQGATTGEGWALYVRDEGVGDTYQIALQVGTSTGGPNNWETTTLIPLDSWVHIAFVFDSDNVTTSPTIYINGDVDTTAVINVSGATYVSDSGNDLLIGNRDAGDRGFDGDIEIVTLYDSAKSALEIRDIYRSQATRFGSLVGGLSPAANGGRVEDVQILGADSNSSSVEGGDILIQAGTNPAGVGTARGGNLTMRAGSPLSNNADGGAVLIEAGNADGVNNAGGGDVTINGGNAVNNQGQGGAVLITAGATLGGITTGGPVTIKGGTGSPITGRGGLVTVEGGDGNDGGGNVEINGGQTTGTFQSSMGSITLQAGEPTGLGGFYEGGSITINAGSRFANTENQRGGSVTIAAGSTGENNSDGGSVTISAGSTNGFSSSSGGDIDITAGDEEGNAAATARGGNITLTAGTSVAGDDGKVIINGALCAITALEASEVRTADATAASADPIDINPGISDTGFDGSDLTLSAGTAGGGGTDGRVLIQGDTIYINDRAGTATVGGLFTPGSFDIKLEGKSAVASSGNAGHSVTLTGGTGDGAGDGGDIVLEPGPDGGTGTDGIVRMLTDETQVEPTAAAVEFVLWVPTFSGSGGGSDFRVQAQPGETTNDDGGDLVLQAAVSGGGTGVDGDVVFRDSAGTRETRATWDPGNFGWLAPDALTATSAGTGFLFTTGAGGATSGDGGDFRVLLQTSATSASGEFSIEGDGPTGISKKGAFWLGLGTGTAVSLVEQLNDGLTSGDNGTSYELRAGSGGGGNSDGGDITFQVGALTGTGSDGRIVLNDSAGAEAMAVVVEPLKATLQGFDAVSAGNAGAEINITGGDGLTTGAGGDVVLAAGSSPSGTDGVVRVLCDPPAEYRTASTFTGAEGRLATAATQESVASGAGTADLATLGTLDTNGQNMKFTVYATIVDDSTDTNVISTIIEQTAYRAGGTVSLLTAHRSDEQGNGATFVSDLSLALVVSSNDVILRATNTSSTVTYTVNTAVKWESQEGGFNA
jgi:hypothetical protein